MPLFCLRVEDLPLLGQATILGGGVGQASRAGSHSGSRRTGPWAAPPREPVGDPLCSLTPAPLPCPGSRLSCQMESLLICRWTCS